METQIHIGGRKIVNPNNILRLKGEINYTTIYFLDGRRKETVATTLKKIEAKLMAFPHFFRITKSTIINLNCITEAHSKKVQMSNGECIIPSRRRGKVFFESIWKGKD